MAASLRFLVILLIAPCLTVSPRAARAETTRATSTLGDGETPNVEPVPSESAGRVVAELGVGTLVAGLTMGAAILMAHGAGIGEGIGIVAMGVLAAPAIVGGTVCAVGDRSGGYYGTCAAAVAGAYLGMLVSIPMMFIVLESASGDAGLYAVLGVLAVGPALGGVIGWHSSRTRQLAPAWTHVGLRTPVPSLPRSLAAAKLGWQVSVPIVAFEF